MKFLRLKYLLLFNSLLISSTAAFFSVTGLAKLFLGNFWAIIIMGSSLELAKITVLSFLYRYWGDISKRIKSYLIFSSIILVLITGIGTYGWLTYSFSNTLKKVNIRQSEIKRIEQRKSLIIINITDLNKNIDKIKDRNQLLSKRIENNEKRIDSLLYSTKKRYFYGVNNSTYMDKEIIKNNEISMSYELKKQRLSDSLIVCDEQIQEIKQSHSFTEIGPLEFLSKIFNTDIEQIVNILIVFIIFVFDPLAIVLLLGYNQLSIRDKRIKKEKGVDILYDSYKKKNQQ